MSEFLGRLSSRKFLVALGAAITLAAHKQWGELVAVVIGYLGIEGGVDAIGSRTPTEG